MRRIFVASLLFVVGCVQTSVDDGGSAPEPARCEVTQSPVASDDDTLGFSADAVLARFGGARVVTLEYYAGGTSELTLELTRTGEAAVIETSVPADALPGEVEEPCGEFFLKIPLELRLTSADGQLAERVPLTWQLAALEEYGNVNEYVDVADLAGSLDVAADRLSLAILLTAEAPSGSLVGVVDEKDGLGSEFNVARFNESTWPQSE